MPARKYSLDTSALIDGLERYYPAATFSGLWEAIDTLIGESKCFASQEVWEEVKKKDEVVKNWSEPRKDAFFLPTNAEVTKEVQAILDRFPRLVTSGGSRNRADPFVIAVAKLNGATVVTGEGNDGSATRPKIPYVCQELGIPCLRFTEMIAAENWIFGLLT